MAQKIVFFSKGFAFNRLVRLRYYEKIFPKDVKMYLITTDRYEDHSSWNLERTKVITLKHNPLKNLFEIRKFCKNNKINIYSNLGHPFGIIPLIFANLFNKGKVLLYYLGDVLEIAKSTKTSLKKLKLTLILIPYLILSKMSHKSAFVGYRSYKKAPYFFLSPKNKFKYLVAPVDTNVFKPYNKIKSRNELGIDKKEKLVIFVGRVTSLKGGKILSELIKLNPNIQFILIGKWLENEVPKLETKNLRFIERVPNEDLPKYYSAADLCFVYNLQGDQPQIVGSESLACGTPVLHTKRVNLPDKNFIIKIDDKIKDADDKIKEFFKKNKRQKNQISKDARSYAIKKMSNKFWEKRYLDFYLS